MTKQHTVYLTSGQWDAIKLLDLTAPTITQADLLDGNDYSGHVMVRNGIDGENVHLDREGNLVKWPPA